MIYTSCFRRVPPTSADSESDDDDTPRSSASARTASVRDIGRLATQFRRVTANLSPSSPTAAMRVARPGYAVRGLASSLFFYCKQFENDCVNSLVF